MACNPLSKSKSGTVLLALLLGGCVAMPDLGHKPAPLRADAISASQSLPGAAAAWPGDQWWTAYQDHQLNDLIEEGLRNSPDMAVASARFRSATALAQQTRAALLPSLNANGQTGYTKQSYNNGFPKEFVPKGWLDNGELNVDLDFDLDLWGKNRAAVAAATSDTRAARIDSDQTNLLLTTAIAGAYVDLARLIAARDIQQRTLALRLATQDLVAKRQQNGLDTLGSVRQADAAISTARADLAAAEEAILLRRHQIAVLVGAGPDRGLSIRPPQLNLLKAQALPQDITTELVGRRPDIAAALARVEAAASRIKVARADFFPAIRLSGLIGFQSLGLDKLLEKDSIYGNVGPAVSLPIFRGGAIRGQYRGARATYDQAVADYDKTVLGAYQETADAVTSRNFVTQRQTDARAALTASEEAYSIARQRYDGGLSTYLDVLNVEDRLLTARLAVVDLEARAFTLDVALVRALGGGFSTADNDRKDRSHG